MTRRGNGYKNLKTVDRDTMNRIVHCIWRIQSAQVPRPGENHGSIKYNLIPLWFPPQFLHLPMQLKAKIQWYNWWSYHEKTKKKKLNKYQSRGILWNTWIRLSPDVKAMKNKERYGSITIKCSLRRHGL